MEFIYENELSLDSSFGYTIARPFLAAQTQKKNRFESQKIRSTKIKNVEYKF